MLSTSIMGLTSSGFAAFTRERMNERKERMEGNEDQTEL